MTAVDRSKLFRDAWDRARELARREGGKARAYLSEALKQAWRKVKDFAALLSEVKTRRENPKPKWEDGNPVRAAAVARAWRQPQFAWFGA